jgi:hypothetical protein
MTHEETVVITRYVKALCPQQAIDRYTPIAWHDLLGEFTETECHAAIAAVARRQPFVAPSEIIAEVRLARRAELGRQRQAELGAAPGAITQTALAEHDPRRQLKDPRPLRETIQAIRARFSRPELTS